MCALCEPVKIAALLLLSLLPALAAASPCPHPVRHQAPKLAFVRAHPCPATGKPTVSCKGFVIDHIVPLCACGKDAPSNMQWQTLSEAKRKDTLERRQCGTTSKVAKKP